MNQTRSLFIIKKYRSILFAAIVVEGVSYIVSLTDSIVAGNMINSTALAAIGLVSPYISFSVFVTSIINSGTIRYYSYYVGSFEKQRATEIFGQGVYMSLMAGFAYAGLLFLFRNPIISSLTPSLEMQQYARDYYDIILLLIVFKPLACLMDNMTIADGGEKLSATANVINIVSNIVLSIVLARAWGVKGIAAASAASQILFILIISLRLLSKNNTLRLIRHWKNRDAILIFRGGIVKASNYALEGLNVLLINDFATRYFDNDTLILLVMIEKFLGVLTLFIGLAMAAQPLIGTLNGENNHKALRHLMRKVCSDMALTGLIFTLITLLTTPYLVRAFGIYENPLHGEGVIALRIVSATLVLHALLTLFFIYYYLMGRQVLAFNIGLIKNLISPLTLAVLFSVLTRSEMGMWVGLAVAPFASFIACSQAIFLGCKKKEKEEFPFLLPRGNDSDTYIYDFDISPDNTVALTGEVNRVLDTYPVSQKIKTMTGLFIEEILMLIRDRNEEKKLSAECTIMVEPSGVRLVMRDSGILFDITDSDASVSSFRQYVVSNMMNALEYKAYMVTTGYNRNELFIKETAAGA